MGVDEGQYSLEEGGIGAGCKRGAGVGEEGGDASPAIALHGEEASVCETKNKAGVSVDVQRLILPGAQGEVYGAQFRDIIGQEGAY